MHCPYCDVRYTVEEPCFCQPRVRTAAPVVASVEVPHEAVLFEASPVSGAVIAAD